MKPVRIFLAIIISIVFLQADIGCQKKIVTIQNRERRDSFLRQGSSASKYIPGEIIVRFRPDSFDENGTLISESIKALNTEFGLISMEALFKDGQSEGPANLYKLKFPEDVDIEEVVTRYSEDPCVIYAEPNFIIRAFEKVSHVD